MTEDQLLVETGRRYFKVTEKIRGGRFEYSGDKHRMNVRYCLSEGRFEDARTDLVAEHERFVRHLRGQFRELEVAIQNGEMTYAGRLFPGLKGDVNSAAVGFETYTSGATGETRTFRAWLNWWSSEVRAGRTYASYCTEKALVLMDSGHLRQAEQYLAEAIESDRHHVRAFQLKERVQQLRRERSVLLREAEEFATVGRFSAANANIDKARAIDSDDSTSFQKTEDRIKVLQVRYGEYNPRWNVGIGLISNTMGVDVDSTGRSLFSVKTGTEGLDSGKPYFLGLETRVRLGRHFQVWGSGAYGTSGYSYHGWRVGSMQVKSFSVGLGFRTVRRERRPFSLQVGAGMAQESVVVGTGEALVELARESRTAPFVRVAIEGRRLSLFVQHGFGFEDVEENLGPIEWSDSYQIGLTFSFRLAR